MAERDDLPTDELLRIALDSARADLHTAVPATITHYDGVKKRADLRIGVRRVLHNEDGDPVYRELPVIPNVPVGWLGAGGFFLHLPAEEGDTGWLMFAETDTSRWESTGDVSNPRDLARHGLGSPMFLPTPRVPSGTEGAYMACPDAFSFGDPSSALLVALADYVDDRIATLQAAFDSHTHLYNPGPGAGAPTSPPASPVGPLDSTACTKLKAE